MVVDSCVILAIIFNEKHAAWALEQISKYSGELRMSTVNLSETLILCKSKQPQQFAELEDKILNLPIRFVAPEVKQAQIAASARERFPINLGDCFAYALAKIEGCGVLTIDADFQKTDLEIIFPGCN